MVDYGTMILPARQVNSGLEEEAGGKRQIPFQGTLGSMRCIWKVWHMLAHEVLYGFILIDRYVRRCQKLLRHVQAYSGKFGLRWFWHAWVCLGIFGEIWACLGVGGTLCSETIQAPSQDGHSASK